MQEARDHLFAIARPRPAGSSEESDARAYCKTQLESSGFSVVEEPFEFSAAVGRWGMPVIGGIAFVVLAAYAVALTGASNGRVPGALLLAILALCAAGARWAWTRGVLSIPLAREQSVNLVAQRGSPSIWLMAHLDTKSQPMPSLIRAAALVLMAGAWLVAGIGGVIGLAASYPQLFAALALLGAVGATVISLSGVGNESPGGADNASGLATVLLVAARIDRSDSLGIVLTSGEELGLAGAWAWVRSRPNGSAINIDTVDDQGAVRCMTHGHRSQPLAAALREVAGPEPPAFEVRGLIPGILTDGVALAGGGWTVVTLSRGTLATLARIHRPSDTVSRLTGEGIHHLAGLIVAYLGGRKRG